MKKHFTRCFSLKGDDMEFQGNDLTGEEKNDGKIEIFNQKEGFEKNILKPIWKNKPDQNKDNHLLITYLTQIEVPNNSNISLLIYTLEKEGVIHLQKDLKTIPNCQLLGCITSNSFLEKYFFLAQLLPQVKAQFNQYPHIYFRAPFTDESLFKEAVQLYFTEHEDQKINLEKFFKFLVKEIGGEYFNPQYSKNFIKFHQEIYVNFFQKENKKLSVQIVQKVINEGNFLFCDDVWYFYQKPIWCKITLDDLTKHLRNIASDITGMYNQFLPHQLIKNVRGDLTENLRDFIPFDSSNYLCWENGFYDFEKKIFIEDLEDIDIFKNKFFRDYLPYKYLGFNQKINDQKIFLSFLEEKTPQIYNWFTEMLINSDLAFLILMFAAAIVKQIPIDKFLFLVGPSQTGKSTCLYLLEKLFLSTSILTLGSNDFGKQFGLQSLIGANKRLILIRDMGPVLSVSSANVLKSLTSYGEPVTVDRKHSTQLTLNFKGGVAIAGNFYNTFVQHAQGILNRRMIPITFEKKIRDKKSFDTLFPKEEIQNLINLIFILPEDLINKTLQNSKDHVEIKSFLTEQFEDGIYRTVADFVEQKIVYKKDGFIRSTVKTLKKQQDNDVIFTGKTLYGEYTAFVEEHYKTRTPESFLKFREKFQLVISSLGWEDLEKYPVSPDRKTIVSDDGVSKGQHRGFINLAWKEEESPEEENGDNIYKDIQSQLE